ncbi:MAG: hypothetical protein AAB578_05185 [Elusimicrobiota bacterium]
MLSGEVPFMGGDLLGLKLRGEYEPLPGSVPEKLRGLVAACLRPEPAQRPGSMREVDTLLLEAA